jgi:hypothetical protein
MNWRTIRRGVVSSAAALAVGCADGESPSAPSERHADSADDPADARGWSEPGFADVTPRTDGTLEPETQPDVPSREPDTHDGSDDRATTPPDCLSATFPAGFWDVRDFSDLLRIRKTGCTVLPSLTIIGPYSHDLSSFGFVEEVGRLRIWPEQGDPHDLCVSSTAGMVSLRAIGSFWSDQCSNLEVVDFGAIEIRGDFLLERASGLRRLRGLAAARPTGRDELYVFGELPEEVCCDVTLVLAAWRGRSSFQPAQIIAEACACE